MTTCRVAHPGADYEVVIGDFADAMPKLEALASGRRLPIISDQRVFGLHGQKLASICLPDPILVPEGEAAKDWASLASVSEELAGLDVARGTPILALGGGSVGDLAGLAASLFKRGCPIVQIPTTMLAQADSAIGGKTAIDAAGQKNLIGTFHHPLMVIVDPAMLDTLDLRQMRSGYAEIVKYGLIADPDFFAWCEANGPAILAASGPVRSRAIEHCIKAKARIVAADPDDRSGARALLNFGHTFGHAIEALAGTSLLHGEAVSVGMILALRFSERLGLCAAEDRLRAQSHLVAMGLPTTLAEARLGGRGPDVLALMAADKKVDQSGIALVLAEGIGRTSLQRGVDMPALQAFLAAAD